MKKTITKATAFDKQFLRNALIMTKIYILILLCSIYTAKASDSYAQNVRVNLELNNVSLSNAIKAIKAQTEFEFAYDANLDQLMLSKVSINVNNEKINKVLVNVLKGTNINFKVIDRIILLSKNTLKVTSGIENGKILQQQKITGVVTDATTGESLPGVSIMVEGTKKGTITGMNGKFVIDVPNPNSVMVFSFIGYNSEKIQLDGRTILEVKMSPDITKLDEVVVIGYGTVKKSDLTGSVSTISSKSLGDRQVSDIGALIQGKASGVDVSRGSIRIRGVTTFNNTDPMIVIDGFMGGNLSTVNANDIENIEVLKDASATAIYGTQGANGVILITTKSGKVGPLKVSLNTFTGFSSATRKMDVLNANQYVDYAIDALTNAGSPIPPKLLTPAVRKDVTNWQDEVFRTSPKHELDLSLSGGSEKATFLLSIGYKYNEAITINGPLNSDLYLRNKNDFKIKKWLRIGNNFSFNYNKNRGSLPSSLINMLPYISVYDPTNIKGLGYGDTNTQTDGTGTSNPVSWSNLFHKEGVNLNYQANLWTELEPVKGLVYRFQSGVSGNFGRSKAWNPQFVNGGSIQSFNSALGDQSSYSYNPLIEQYLTYSNKFGKHDISAMAGNSFSNYGENGGIGIYGNSFTDFTVKNVYYANANGVLNESYNKYTSLSYFGRVNYQFSNKYLLTANFRADGSPSFAPANRWGYFPSVALAWKLHEENFIKNLHIFDDFKLRAGWGKSGNANIGDFMYLEKVWNNNVYYQLGTDGTRVNGATVMANASGNIKWESTISKTIAFDMTLLQNKLTATVEYFIKSTNDILFGVPRPPSLGYGSNNVPGNAIVNAASCENKGFELSIGYRGTIGKLGYSMNGNYTYVDNKVTSLGLGQPYINNINAVGGTYPVSRTDIGNSIGYFYGFIADGIFKTQAELDAANEAAKAKGFDYYQSAATRPGDVRFKDLNGDGHIDYASDRTKIGSPIPKHYYALSMILDYNNFDFNVQFQGLAGSSILNGNYVGERAGTSLWNQATSVLNRWRSEQNQGNGIQPRAVIGDPANNNRPSTLWLSSGNYLKVRLLSLGYSLPKLVSTRIGVDKLRIYCSLDNFFTFTKYSQGFDPDINTGSGNLDRGIDVSGFPNAKSIVFGFQLGF